MWITQAGHLPDLPTQLESPGLLEIFFTLWKAATGCAGFSLSGLTCNFPAVGMSHLSPDRRSTRQELRTLMGALHDSTTPFRLQWTRPAFSTLRSLIIIESAKLTQTVM